MSNRNVLSRVIVFKNWADAKGIDQDLITDMLPVLSDFYRDSDIAELGYKILSVVDTRSGDILELNEVDSKFYSFNSNTNGYFFSALKNHEINSIFRLSDGAIFKVGDSVDLKDEEKIYKIDGFKKDYKNNKLWISVDLEKGYGASLSVVRMVAPLFQTIDGVDIYPGDKYFYLHSTNDKLSGPYECTFAEASVIPTKAFSTKELAKEYKDSKAIKYNLDDMLFVINDNPFGMKYTAEDLVELLKNRG